MIRMIQGTVVDSTDSAVIIKVQGIGYIVYTPNPYQYQLESELCLHTHLAVRETALDLYGFPSPAELTVFSELLTIPKIGPKSALQIMNQADLTTLRTAVSLNDPSHLTKISGIGKKTAEKIVQELSNENSYLMMTAETAESENQVSSPALNDAIDALVTLGYPQKDARHVVRDLPDSVTSTNDAVRAALKILGQNS